MADGTITFSTALDNGQLEKDLKAAEREVDRIRKRLDKARAGRSALEQEMDDAQRAIERASEKAEELRQRLDALRGTDPTDAGAWQAAQSEIAGVEAALARAEEREAKLADDKWELDEKWKRADDSVRQYEGELRGAAERSEELGTRLAKAYRGSGGAVSEGMQQASAAMDRFASRVGTMLKRVFVFGAILQGVRALRDGVGEALMESDRFSATLANLRATAQGFINAIANAIGPVLTSAINMTVAALTTLASIIDRVFGTSIVASIEQARAAAENTWRMGDAADDAAKSVSGQADAARDLAKAQKEANKSLLAFDELNQMSAENDDSGSGGSLGGVGGAAAGAGEGVKPDWDAFDVGKISDKLAEIMLILGAALMAVGAVLAFSGINIPLGLTLMAIGALMIYTAYREKWDELPEKVRSSITTALVVVGIVAVVLGAVLAFSGVNVPLGIGLMAAGLTMLGVAAALNWDALGTELRTAITMALLVVGVIALVVGAVLAFSGANIPLGLGLMALGALSIATAAVLNWEALTGSLSEAVATALEVAGIVAVALGAALAFSAVNIPLGLALIALGVAALVGAVALDWKRMGGDLKRTVTKALEVVGIVAVVIGAVLAFTSVNIPLGVGLMALGAAAIVGSIGLNWDELPDKVLGVVTEMLKLVGAVALALGAVIALSGVNIALGIGLIAAGAAALVTAAALNWNTLSDKTKSTITAIMGIVGAAVLVIGIILCLSGVGIPLGIGLILAGAAALGTAAAINWNFLQNKAKEIWGGITKWFNTNVKKIFTPQWWQKLFSSIGDGLQSAINKALQGFQNFISKISSGISSITSSISNAFSSYNSLRSSASSFRSPFSSLSIPHLAQGAVLPPNREFMAVLGDQTRGNNIETPEGLMRQVVREEAGAMLADAVRAMMSQQQPQGMGDVVLVVGNRELARATVRGLREMDDTGELAGSGLVFV